MTDKTTTAISFAAMTDDQKASVAAQRAATTKAAIGHGFDFAHISSYITLVENIITSFAEMFDVVHTVVDEKGNVTPVEIQKVAAAVGNTMTSMAAANVAPGTTGKASQIAATVADHADQIAKVAGDVKALGETVASQSSTLAKVAEAVTMLPALAEDVEMVKSAVKGDAPAGGSHQ